MAEHGSGQLLAVGAGVCAACASVFAKLAVTSHVVPEICQNLLRMMTPGHTNSVQSSSRHSSVQQDSWADVCVHAAICLRVVCFGLVFVFNAVMWTMFVKSLQKCSSVIATVTNTASNFFFTALSSWLLFGESLSVTWWCGAASIIVGLLMINADDRSSISSVKQD